MTLRRVLLASVISLLSACYTSDSTSPLACTRAHTCDDPNATARLRVVQGTSGGVDILLDDYTVLSSVPAGQASAFVRVTPGTHVVGVRRLGAAANSGTRELVFGAQDTTTLILIDSSTVINPIVLTDTGATPVAGKSKLRVVHFATKAPEIDVWRTQPDWATLIRVMFPFNYRAASSYLQSDPGNWLVVVTPKDQTTQLYSTGSINIPGGQLRTVVLLDSPTGGITSVILNR